MKIYNALYKTKTDKKYVTPEGVEVITPQEAQDLIHNEEGGLSRYVKYYGQDSTNKTGRPWANQGVAATACHDEDLFLVNTSVFPPKMYHVIPQEPKELANPHVKHPLVTLEEVEEMAKGFRMESILVLFQINNDNYTVINSNFAKWGIVGDHKTEWKDTLEYAIEQVIMEGVNNNLLTIIDRRPNQCPASPDYPTV